MSTDERDLIFGRLSRQVRESRQTVAAIEAKLSGHYRFLSGLALALNGTWNPKPTPVTSFEEAISLVSKLPSKDEIVQDLQELQREQVSLKSLEAQLKAMEQ